MEEEEEEEEDGKYWTKFLNSPRRAPPGNDVINLSIKAAPRREKVESATPHPPPPNGTQHNGVILLSFGVLELDWNWIGIRFDLIGFLFFFHFGRRRIRVRFG